MDRRTRRDLLTRLTADARRIARQFGLEYRSLQAERSNVRSRYGICYDDGTIKIRLNHAATGEPLKYSSLVNTLCHELAHLRHFDHGPRFKAFYLELLSWSREQGIYRPRIRRPPRAEAGPVSPGLGTGRRSRRESEPRDPTTTRTGPLQLDLFG